MRTYRLMIATTALVIGTGTLAPDQTQAVSTDRGVWFFDVEDRVGSSQIVGNTAKEIFTVQQFQLYNIARVYESFKAPVPPPNATDIAAWHARLSTASITPMLLLSDTGSAADLNFFTQQLINFNNGRPANEKYGGVKLDLEPHATGAWSSGTPTDRRDMLFDLRDTYASIRAHLDANGESATPIYADIPPWFDVTGATIGWTNDAERDQWYTDINSSLDGLTLMAFGTSLFSVIEANVNWEINNFGDDVRIGLEASVGPAATWPDFPTFMNMAAQIEDHYDGPSNNPSGHTIGVDFQDFVQLFDASLPEPTTAVLGLTGLAALVVSLRRRPIG